MKATREQVTEMLKQAGLIEPGCWLVDGNKYEALVHLAQQFTLDQLRAQKPDFAILDGASNTSPA